jgi:6-phosphogluconolactonase (cycloisomerase 2 family)
MRMKLNKSSQLLLASVASLLAAGLLSACSTLTTDFVYVTSSKAAGTNSYGEVDIFEINSESGHMRQIPDSPTYSEGRDPVAEAVSTDYASLFVVNQDDNTVVQFTIGSDGKLYPLNTVNTPGVYPMSIAISSSNVFVLDTYQPLSNCSSAAPCSGAVGVFPISSSKISTTTANGALTYWPLCSTGYKTNTAGSKACSGTESDVIVPTGITVSKNGSYVYVSAYDSTASTGYLFSFSVGTSGALTPVAVLSGIGTKLSSIATDANNSYVYATDYTGAKVYGFSTASGVLTALSGSPYAAGNGASAIALNPTYAYAYVANAVDSNVIVYSVSNGVLTQVATYASGLQPVAIGVDPSKSSFIFTANFLGSNVSNWEQSTSDGTLLVSQGSPFSANTNPTAVAAVPHK